jgi:hypothetical protein
MRNFFSRPPHDLRRDEIEKCAHRVHEISKLKHPVNRGIVCAGGPRRVAVRSAGPRRPRVARPTPRSRRAVRRAGPGSAGLGVMIGRVPAVRWRRAPKTCHEAPMTGRRPLRRHGLRPLVLPNSGPHFRGAVLSGTTGDGRAGLVEPRSAGGPTGPARVAAGPGRWGATAAGPAIRAPRARSSGSGAGPRPPGAGPIGPFRPLIRTRPGVIAAGRFGRLACGRPRASARVRRRSSRSTTSIPPAAPMLCMKPRCVVRAKHAKHGKPSSDAGRRQTSTVAYACMGETPGCPDLRPRRRP